MVSYSFNKYWVLTLVIVSSYIAKNLFNIDLNYLFWDLNVYVRAVNDVVQGTDPYRQDVIYPFIYHPYVLKTFTFLNYFFSIKIWLVCLYFVSCAFFIYELVLFSRLNRETFSSEKENLIILVLLAALCFGDAGLVAIKTGNITLFLHFLLLTTFFYAYRKKSCTSTTLFVLIIIINSVIKPYFLAYVLLLPYLIRKSSALHFSLSIFLVCFFIWISGETVTPDLYSSFMKALRYQTLGQGDLGYSIFGLVHTKTGKPLGIIFHCLIMLSYLLLLLLYAKKSGLRMRSSYFIPLIIIFIIFINPRMKIYDFPIAILFSYLYLWIYGKSPARTIKIIAISMFLSAVPNIFKIFKALKIYEPNEILLNIPLFQIFGFLSVMIAILFYSFNQSKSGNLKI